METLSQIGPGLLIFFVVAAAFFIAAAVAIGLFLSQRSGTPTNANQGNATQNNQTTWRDPNNYAPMGPGIIHNAPDHYAPAPVYQYNCNHQAPTNTPPVHANRFCGTCGETSTVNPCASCRRNEQAPGRVRETNERTRTHRNQRLEQVNDFRREDAVQRNPDALTNFRPAEVRRDDQEVTAAARPRRQADVDTRAQAPATATVAAIAQEANQNPVCQQCANRRVTEPFHKRCTPCAQAPLCLEPACGRSLRNPRYAHCMSHETEEEKTQRLAAFARRQEREAAAGGGQQSGVQTPQTVAATAPHIRVLPATAQPAIQTPPATRQPDPEIEAMFEGL